MGLLRPRLLAKKFAIHVYSQRVAFFNNFFHRCSVSPVATVGLRRQLLATQQSGDPDRCGQGPAACFARHQGLAAGLDATGEMFDFFQ